MHMTNTILTIAKRELKAYFLSPIAYVYIITFLAVSNWIFFRAFFIMDQADLRPFFGMMPWVFLFFVPAVAMGKWAEEKRAGTLEILLTLAVRDIDVVIAKFLAAMGLIIISILLTLPLALTVSLLGPIDMGPVIGGYLGLILMSAAYLSIGLFVSAMTNNQIIAFIIGVVASFLLFILGQPFVLSGLPAPLTSLFQYLGLGGHFESIGRGVVDTRDIVYYISVIGFFLWCNVRAVGARSLK